MAKTKTGELTVAEIKKLIRAHNVLMDIKIPSGATKNDIYKILDDRGYMVNHIRKSIQRRYKNERKPNVTLAQAEKILKPKPKTALEKQKIAESKAKKEEKKKKEVRAIKKEALEQQKKVMDRKKALKKESIEKSKEDMPKPKQPKQTQKLKSQKQDEVRPKEKVGRPKVDPKKIKVIEPKKEEPKKDTKLQIDFRSKKKTEIINNPTNEKIRKAIEKEYPNYSDYDRLSLIKLLTEAMSKGKVGNIRVLERKNEGKDLQIQQNILGSTYYGKRLILKKEKVEKPKKETGKSRLEEKNKMMTVFKDIITGFKEILEENPDNSKAEINSMKIILDKLNKGSMSFSKVQKGLIKRAIDAYLDMDFVNDPELETEVNIAKKLQEKYK